LNIARGEGKIERIPGPCHATGAAQSRHHFLVGSAINSAAEDETSKIAIVTGFDNNPVGDGDRPSVCQSDGPRGKNGFAPGRRCGAIQNVRVTAERNQ
jgi:hypothetical protein